MKKNWWKKAVTAGLTAAMVLGLAGCGKGGDKMENAALAKEHVYKFQEFEMPDLGGDDYSIRGSIHMDGKIYVMAQVYHWSEVSDELDIKMLSMNDDGSDVKLVDLEIPDWKRERNPKESLRRERSLKAGRNLRKRNPKKIPGKRMPWQKTGPK